MRVARFVSIAVVTASHTAEYDTYDGVFALRSVREPTISFYQKENVSRCSTDAPTRPPKSFGRAICFNGEHDVGKTFFMNKMMESNFPSGTNFSTIGISYASRTLPNGEVYTCFDFAGFGIVTPLLSSQRDTEIAEMVLQDVAASLPCLNVIVVPKLTYPTRKYIDTTIDRILSTRAEQALSTDDNAMGVVAITLHVVVIINNRNLDSPLSALRDFQGQVPTETPRRTTLRALGVESKAADKADMDLQNAVLGLAAKTHEIQWRHGSHTVFMHVLHTGQEKTVLGDLLLDSAIFQLRDLAKTSQIDLSNVAVGVKEGLEASLPKLFRSKVRQNVKLNRVCQGTVDGVDWRWQPEVLDMDKGSSTSVGAVLERQEAFAIQTRGMPDNLKNMVAWSLRSLGSLLFGSGSDNTVTATSVNPAYPKHHLSHKYEVVRTIGDEIVDTEPELNEWSMSYTIHQEGKGVSVTTLVAPGCTPLTTKITVDDRNIVVVSCDVPAVPATHVIIPNRYVGGAEQTVDFYRGGFYTFCPAHTEFNGGLIRLFFLRNSVKCHSYWRGDLHLRVSMKRTQTDDGVSYEWVWLTRAFDIVLRLVWLHGNWIVTICTCMSLAVSTIHVLWKSHTSMPPSPHPKDDVDEVDNPLDLGRERVRDGHETAPPM